MQQIHDPDGAQHAWGEARHAQDVARKAHVQIALLPRAAAPAAPIQARLAAGAPGPVRGPEPARPGGGALLAMTTRTDPGRGPRIERAGPVGFAAPGRRPPERLAATAKRPEPPAQFNVHGRERAFEAPAESHLRAAEQSRPTRQERGAAMAHDVHARAEASPAVQPRHLQIVMAPKPPAEHGGGGGDHGGNHAGPPQQDRHGHGH